MNVNADVIWRVTSKEPIKMQSKDELMKKEVTTRSLLYLNAKQEEMMSSTVKKLARANVRYAPIILEALPSYMLTLPRDKATI